MACSGDRDTDLTKIALNYASAHSKNLLAMGYIQDAMTHWNLHEDHLAIEDILSGMAQLWWAIDYLVYKYTPFYPECPVPHFLKYHTVETATVDMDGILSAMLTAKLEQIEYFIGLVDAYRVSLWNRPFNAEFYAALARGFMT